MVEYGILDQDTYNADEKGFAIGILNRSKRIFTKATWASKSGAPLSRMATGNDLHSLLAYALPKQSYKLDLQQRQEYHGGAVFWSPRKIREARAL
ncbi:hypothetical protein P3342_001707 [Pyrenophora teres f. teres]|nr:hypothetical protein P3342_001707 [Pyrenophora teres f. teres]